MPPDIQALLQTNQRDNKQTSKKNRQIFRHTDAIGVGEHGADRVRRIGEAAERTKHCDDIAIQICAKYARRRQENADSTYNEPTNKQISTQSRIIIVTLVGRGGARVDVAQAIGGRRHRRRRERQPPHRNRTDQSCDRLGVCDLLWLWSMNFNEQTNGMVSVYPLREREYLASNAKSRHFFNDVTHEKRLIGSNLAAQSSHINRIVCATTSSNALRNCCLTTNSRTIDCCSQPA
jgi:hypothetical protein